MFLDWPIRQAYRSCGRPQVSARIVQLTLAGWLLVGSFPIQASVQAQVVDVGATPAASTSSVTSRSSVGFLDDGIVSEQTVQRWLGPTGIGSAWKTMAALSVFSLAPAILLMTTSFIRISVVLALLRQAIGTQMLPSNQVVTSLTLFMTVLIMSPTWKQVYEVGVAPYTAEQIPAATAWQQGILPVRTFMSEQIERAGNGADVYLFFDHFVAASGGESENVPMPETYDDIPLEALLPAFVLSELKTAFLIGFQVFLPFLVIDLVVASVTTSMGMMMLPPMMVSLPMKLLLFVLVDGWHLVVGMLLQSFGPAM